MYQIGNCACTKTAHILKVSYVVASELPRPNPVDYLTNWAGCSVAFFTHQQYRLQLSSHRSLLPGSILITRANRLGCWVPTPYSLAANWEPPCRRTGDSIFALSPLEITIRCRPTLYLGCMKLRLLKALELHKSKTLLRCSCSELLPVSMFVRMSVRSSTFFLISTKFGM